MIARAAALGALALFSILYWWGMLAHDPTLVLEDSFGGTATDLALSISDPPQWIPGAPLILGAGQSGHLVYDVSLPPEARAHASVVCADPASLDARLRVLWSIDGVPGEAVHPLRPGANEVDFTADVPPTGLVRLALEAQMPLGTVPQPAFGRFTVTVAIPRTLHGGALVFLYLTGALVWVGIPSLVIGELRDRALPALGRVSVIASMGAAGLLMLLPHRVAEDGAREPLLFGRKFFDDSRAISNAALLVANGGDTTQLYFRSFERPGFLAHTVPLCLAFPQRFLRASYAPSDFQARLWREFDRAGATHTTLRQFEISLVAWGEAMLLPLLWALIWRRLGAGARVSVIAGALGAAAFAHVISAPQQVNAPVTLTWNLLANAVAVLATLRLLDGPSRWRAAGAGALLALAALTKTTAVTSVAPLAALWIGRALSAPPDRWRGLWLWPAAAIALATAVVLWWFEGLMGGLVATLRQHPDDFARIMEQHPEYLRRSWVAAGQTLWALAGPGWLLVALGVTVGARRPSLRAVPAGRAEPWRVSPEAWTFALLWALSGVQALVMPFLFPRFFKYMAPGLGLLAAAGMAALGERWCRRGDPRALEA